MSNYRTYDDEIPIYASVPYETSDMNEIQDNDNSQQNYPTISLRNSYNNQATLLNIIKQRLIDTLQAIEMTNLNSYPYFIHEESSIASDLRDIKVWLLIINIILCLVVLISVSTLMIKLNSVLP